MLYWIDAILKEESDDEDNYDHRSTGRSTGDEITRRFERRYWLSSADFYELYSQGLLDDGQHRKDFSEWAGFYKLKLKREAALEQLSQRRLEHLRSQATGKTIELLPEEPTLELA